MEFPFINEKENYLMNILAHRPLRGREVFEVMNNAGYILSRQSVYALLQKLVAQEIVVKQGLEFVLNKQWLREAQRQLAIWSGRGQGTLASMSDGEKVSYRFSNVRTADIFWSHILDENRVDLIGQSTDGIYVYHDISWGYLARPKAERAWITSLEELHVPILFTIKSADQWSRGFKKEYANDQLRINVGNDIGLRPGSYLNIFGDYIFEMRMGRGQHEALGAVAQSEYSGAEIGEQFRQAINLDYTTKLFVTKNQKKATLLKKKMGRDFVG